MPTPRRPLVLTLAALLVVASSAAAKKGQPIEIKIRGVDGTALAGVAVSLAAEGGTTWSAQGTTDAAGLWAVEVPDAKGSYRLRAARAAFHPFEQLVNLKEQPVQRGQPLGVNVSLAPFGPTEWYNEGVRALQANDLAAAEADFAKAVELDPAFGKAWGVLGMLALERKEFAVALADADRALASDAADIPALRTRYDALLSLNRAAEADLALTTLAEKDSAPEVAHLLFNAGAEAANQGNSEHARRRLGEALARIPNLWQAHIAFAEIAVREKRYADAVASLDSAIALNPRNFKALERKAQVLRAMGNEEAAKAIDAAIDALKTPQP